MAQLLDKAVNKIVVCVIGDNGVGKTTFVKNCLGSSLENSHVHRSHCTMEICGISLNIEIIDDPLPSEISEAKVALILFDVTNRSTFSNLPELLDKVTNLAPKAFICVIGNKADLLDNTEVEFKEAHDKCFSLDSHIIYFHLSANETKVVEHCFWDIISRPLIFKHVSTATQNEAKEFLQNAMLWCLNRGCFQLLTHLRSLGYPVTQKVIARNPTAMAKYLYHTYPLIVVPSFRNIDNHPLYEQESFDNLYDLERSMEVIDNRPYIEVMRLYALVWKDIHLVTFSVDFLKASTKDTKFIVHVDLSHNKLLRVPDELVSLLNLESLNVSHNELHGFPLPSAWGPKLAILNLSHNKIYKKSFTSGGSLNTGSSINRKLWYLDISSNSLLAFPPWVLQLRGLRFLHLEGNKKITALPNELCSLPNLSSVCIDGLKLIDPPLCIAQQGFPAMKRYMQQREEASAPWNFLQLIIVGPESSGKTHLSARLRDVKFVNTGPTKGVQIEDWRFRIREFLTFRRDHFHFDVWDFGGSEDYSEVFHHFPAVASVHILVLSIHAPYQDLFRWLVEIQSHSNKQIPIIIVFTHLDTITSKADREQYVHERLAWIGEHITGNHIPLLKKVDHNSFTNSLRTIADPYRRFDGNNFQLSELCTHQTGSAAHLMPSVIDVAFVSNISSSGIPQLRSRLYKILTEPIPTLLPILGPLGMGIAVPAVYVELSQVVYNLRLQSQRSSERFLYTVADLDNKILLRVKNRPNCELLPVLHFMKQCGLIGLHKTQTGDHLVSLNPQLVGNIIARVLRISKSNENSKGFLPTSHINMILGEPAGNINKDDFYGFFHRLNLFANLEGTTIVPSCTSMLPMLPVDRATLEWKRSFFLAYFPMNFWNDFSTVFLTSFTPEKDIEYSFTTAASNVINPVTLQSGAKLFVWKHNILLLLSDKSVFYVLLDSSSCNSKDGYFYRHIDVWMCGSLEIQAQLMSTACDTFQSVLSKKYPGLLRTNLGHSLVDNFLPLERKQQNVVQAENEKVECKPRSRSGSTTGSMKLSHSFPSRLDKPYLRAQSETAAMQKGNTSILQWFKDNDVTFNCSTAVLDEVYGQNYLPFSVWECLEIAYHSTVVKHCGIPVHLEEFMPEIFLSLKSLPKFYHSTSVTGVSPQNSYSYDNGYLLSDQELQETGGFFLRHFYKPSHKEVCIKHSVNYNKMMCLLECVEMAKKHYMKLKTLQSDHIVSVCGINVNPPTVALELAPCGSLRGVLKNKPILLNRSTSHSILMQVCKAINFLVEHKVHYHNIQSENILIWTLDPVVVRLSDAGVMEKSYKCTVCTLHKEFPVYIPNSALDIFMLGILSFELATGERPYEGIYTLPMLITSIIQGHLDISIEASLSLRRASNNTASCSKTCLEMFMQECFDIRRCSNVTSTIQLLPKLSLCSGDGNWSPLRTCVNIECIENSTSTGLVYWASGSRGLVVGTLNPLTGQTSKHILQAAPTPTSGMFKNRKGKPAPIAVGRASAIAIVKETQQMWVGIENGSMGSVYVFTLPDMNIHYYVHMQDAVLCLLACNDALYKIGASERSKHSVLIGLANGTIQIFTGHSSDGTTVCDNPLRGQVQVIAIPNRLSCLSMVLTRSGDIWCACGDTIQILDTSTLKFRDSLMSNQHRNSPVLQHSGLTTSTQNNPGRLSIKEVTILAKLHENTKADLIVLLVFSSQGIWSVVRRGTSVKLWDINTSKIKTEFDIKSYFDDDLSTNDSITALAAQGQVIWIGTRAGKLLLLDISSPQPHEIPPLLGVQQYCRNNGKVKCIVPITGINAPSASLSVVCSLEQADEISSILLTWEYQNKS